MLIAKADKASESGAPPDPKLMAAVGQMAEELAKTGVLVGTGGLFPSLHGARVKFSGGNLTVTDGPFTETKELIAGYAIVDVNSKEEAIELSKRFLRLHAEILGPGYESESEVRQMMGTTDHCSLEK